MKRWSPLETWIKRQLSRSPRAKRLASAVRRRVSPAFRRGLAASHWDDRVAEVESSAPQGWLDVERIEVEHIRPRVSGDPDVSYLDHFLAVHLPDRPVDRLLSLGCGGGNLERALVVRDAARRIDAFDVSPESIALARRLAEEAGFADRITYAVADIDRIELEAGAYDAVVIKQALHHFEALEHVYDQVRRALVPGGIFLFNEFVGPSRFQWSDEQLEHANRWLRDLPKRLRRRAPVVKIHRPLVADMVALDPSESVRSAEILPLLRDRFEIVEEKPYGGTLLHLVLGHLLPVLDLDAEEDVEILRGWMRDEGRPLDAGELPSDFVYLVARPLRE